VIPPKAGFVAWTTEGEDPTHELLVERLGKVAMVATAKGADGMRATLVTWHQRLGHPSFKTGCVSRERRRRYGDNGPAEEDTRS